MRRIYDGFGPIHDPLLRAFLPLVDGHSEEQARAAILEATRLPRGRGRVLDACCGSGAELLGLARRFPEAQLFGVDLSVTMVDLGRRHLSEAGVEAWLGLADVHSLPFPDASFELVVSVGAINNFADKRRALAEMVRVLKPGGMLVLVDEELDGSRRHSLFHRAMFRLLTFYDLDPRNPSHLLEGVEQVRVEQITRYYYLLQCRRSGAP